MKRNLGTALIVAGVLSALNTPQASAANVNSYSQLSTAIQNGTSPINVTANITAEGNLGSINSGSTSITMGSNSLSGTNNGTSYGGISVGTGAALSISGTMKDFTAPNGGAASVNNGTLTVGSNSTFTNNTATNWYGGGAIYGRDSEITIDDNVTFDSNNTTELDDGSGYGNAGGAIASWGTDLTIGNGADFKNNGTGTSAGGAIYSDGTTTNPDGTFSDVGSLTIGNGADFTDNSSSARGGAIYNGDAKADIGSDANFSGNTSGSGGAIYNFDGGYPKVDGNDVGMKVGEGATFDNNTATTGNGGAISNNYSDIEIGKDSSFTNNTAAGNGGAINNVSYKDDVDDLPGTVTINGGADFSGNTAAGNGGAIYNGGTLNLDTAAGDITFSNNTANGSSNDLFQKDGGVTNITGDSNTISFGSGIAGSGEINKTGDNTLELAADNSGFTGTFTQSNGETVVTSDGSMFTGENNIEGGNIKFEDESVSKDSTINLTSNSSGTTHGSMEISIGDGKTVDLGTTITAESSQNVVNKTGSGDLTVTDKDYSDFEGTFNSKEGTTEFTGDDAKLFQTTNVESGSELKLTDGAQAVKGDLTIADGATVTLSGSGSAILAAVDTDISGDLNINTGSTVDLNAGDSWTGKVTIDGGELNYSDLDTNGQLVANSGDLNINSGTLNIGNGSVIAGAVDTTIKGDLNITGTGDVTLNAGDSWTGDITLGGGSLTVSDITNQGDLKADSGNLTTNDGSTINIGDGSYIKNDVVADLGGDTNITTGGDVSLNAGDSWTGDITLGGGSLTVDDITNDGKLIANSGDLNLGSNGNLNIGAGSSIKDAVNADLAGDVNITTGGDVSLNAGDSWTGDITLGGGSLTVDDITNDGKLIANSGDLNLGSNGNLNIGAGSSIKNAVNADLAGDVNITTGGDVELNAGDSWTGDITLGGGSLTVDDITNDGKLIANSGELNLGSNGNLNIGAGSSIKDAVNADLAGDVNITTGGDVELNAGDSWTGDITLGGGSLTVDDITNDGKLIANSGDLNLGSNGNLNIGAGSSIKDAVNADLAGDVNINTGGDVSLNAGDSWTGKITMDGGELSYADLLTNGQLIANDGTLKINSGTLNIGNGSIIAGAVDTTITGDLNITGTGDVTLNTGDSWTGDITLGGGSLTIDDITNDGKLIANSGDLNLGSNGTLNIGEGSSIKNAVNADLAGDVNITTGGDVELNAGDSWTGDITLGGGSLTVDDITNDGKLIANSGELNLGSNGTLDIGAGSVIKDAVVTDIQGELNISNGGQVTINNGDSVSGSVNLETDGKLTIDDIALDLTGNKFTQNDGILNLTNNASMKIDTGLAGGTVDIGNNSTLELANTGEITMDSTLSNSSSTATILQSGSGTTNYGNDLSAYTGTYRQTDGTSNYTDKFFGGSSILEKGVINFKDGSSMTSNSSLAMGDGTNVNINVGDGHNQNYNNFLDTEGATGSSQIVKDGSGTMTLSGDNSKYTGTFTQMEGVTEVAENTKLFGTGSHTIIENGSMNLNNGVETSAGSHLNINTGAQLNVNNTNGNIDLKSDIDGGGEINKNEDGNLIFSGDNTGFSGTTNINSSGDITFVNGLFGTVNFGDIDGKHVGIIADTVNGEINQTRDATIKYSTVNDIDLVFNDKVNVSKGTLEAVAREGKDVNFNGDVNIADAKIDVTAKNINFSNVVGVTDSNLDVKSEKVTFGDDVNIKDSTINSYAKSTIFNNNLLLENGTLNIAYNGFDVTNNLTVGSTVNVMNGIIANNNIGGDLVVGPSGQSDFKIDIKPRGWTSDKTIINGSINSALQGTVNISDFQFVGKAPIDRYIPLQLFQTSNPISDNIAFAATNKEIFTPIGYYRLFSTGGGGYTANLVKYNPQVFRGQVATTASYANQLVVNNTLFDHVNVISQRILAENNANKYAASIPQFAPYQYSRKTGGLWVKAYGNFETIGMTQGLNVGNNAYGTLVGADFPVVDLENGWSFLPTAYIGYNGAHQTFNYTGMTQNGAQAGAMGTFMKDNFIGSLLAYGGGYGNQMEVAGFTENTGNWFAGAAAKAAYNFHPSKNFIIQPTLLASYNYFGSQNWHADFGDMSMSSSLLNGINAAPGLNLIYGRETWSVYATFQYVFNIMGYSKGRAGNVDLEGIKMRHDYFEYGIGFTKTWKERLDTYLQITMRNGARTGVGFQGGLTFRF